MVGLGYYTGQAEKSILPPLLDETDVLDDQRDEWNEVFYQSLKGLS